MVWRVYNDIIRDGTSRRLDRREVGKYDKADTLIKAMASIMV